MSNQLDLGFDAEFKEKARQARFAKQRNDWKICWDWDGPEVGQPLEVGSCCVKDVCGVRSFWYMAPCIAENQLSPDKWLVRVQYYDTDPEHCRRHNGIKLILETDEIWPPVRHLTNHRCTV